MLLAQPMLSLTITVSDGLDNDFGGKRVILQGVRWKL